MSSGADEKVAVADWERGSFVLKNRSRLIGDTLYYTDGTWSEESSREYHTAIYRQRSGEREAEKILELQDEMLLAYTADRKHAVYVLYKTAEKEKTAYFLQKVCESGETAYCTEIKLNEVGSSENQDILAEVSAAEADGEGNLLILSSTGVLLVFDKEGNSVCENTGFFKSRGGKEGSTVQIAGGKTGMEEAGNGERGLVNTGETGIFGYEIQGRRVLLQKVNTADGKTGPMREVQLSDESSASLQIFSGYEKGVFISDSDCLWSFDTETDTLMKIVFWGDSTINLNDFDIDAIGVLQEDALLVLAHRSYEDTALVRIERKESGQIQKKQSVTLAAIEGITQEYTNGELEKLAAEFNRISGEYQIEFVTYSSDFELHTALIRGEGPDIFDFGTGRMDIRVLAKKGVLENLSPYFAQSEVIGEEQLLASVRRAGTVSGELVCIFPSFRVNGFVVKKGIADKGGWTADQYLELGKQHPEAALFDFGDTQYYKNNILRTVLMADMENYINWEEKQCCFDDEYFISVLNNIKELPVPEDTVLGDRTQLFAGGIAEVVEERFRKGELLTNSFTGSGIGGFEYQKEQGYMGGDFAEMAGYPNKDGRPCYKMDCATPLAVNSASPNKEGAWAFLEFLLSEEYQGKEDLQGFPVRQDIFDRHMALTKTDRGAKKITLTREERREVANIVENAYWPDAAGTGEILGIIVEEAASVWTGDKTAEEAAEIIQSRVSMYVNE